MAAAQPRPAPTAIKDLGGRPPGREKEMKLVKLTMLAATAAFASMAFIGASSASATHTVIQLCKEQELVLCLAGNLITHPLKGKILALAKKGTFKALFTITCPSGHGESTELLFTGTEEIPLTLAELVFYRLRRRMQSGRSCPKPGRESNLTTRSRTRMVPASPHG